MPIFGRRAVPLPRTSYGYAPPPDATADRGWSCPSDSCGESGVGRVRRWPHPCPQCHTPTDPLFDAPWDREARGARLTWLARQEPDNSVYASAVLGWRFDDALRQRDLQAAESLRLAGRRFIEQQLVAEPRFFHPGDFLFPVISSAIEFGYVNLAAEELIWWATRCRATADNVEDDNAQRTDGRQLLHLELRFLLQPDGARHASAEQIAENAHEHSRAFSEVLTLDIQQDLARLGW